MVGAAATTAVAGAVAGARRADGDCFTICNPGTVCNPKTGYCDPLPCRGQCMEWEKCDESGMVAHCTATVPVEMGVQRKDREPPPKPAGPADAPH